jgi:FdhE protein
VRVDRGAPGGFGRRLERAAGVERTPAVAAQMLLLIAVLEHQRERADAGSVVRAATSVADHESSGGAAFPLLDLDAAVAPILEELGPALSSLGAGSPAPLRRAGEELLDAAHERRQALVSSWLDDPSLLDPRPGFWIRVAAAPVLELAAARLEPPSRTEWSGPACPACGGLPQVSVIGEESGEFMAGSPRYLVCARCALWWGFPRATCVSCGESVSTRLHSYLVDDPVWARLDVCDTCSSYIKTFDLRRPGAADVVPLVDDVATLTLDLWALEHGCRRPSPSLAGV